MEAPRANLSETVTTDPGKPAVIGVRPYTTEDWERDNVGRVYESTAEMDAALYEYCALPDAESA